MPLVPIIIALLIFAVVVWVISILPIPATTPPSFPIRTVLYILAAVALIVYLLRYV